MRAPTPDRRRRAPLAVAMTPMIDVVFLLLVFFLCTASFEEPEEDLAASLTIEKSVAATGGEPAEPPPLESVTIVGAGVSGVTTWTVNQGRSTTDPQELIGLLVELASIERSIPVTIDAGSKVPLGDMVSAYDAARAAGFGRVLIAASADAIGETP